MYRLYQSMNAACIGLQKYTTLSESFSDPDKYYDETTAIARGSCIVKFELQALAQVSGGGYIVFAKDATLDLSAFRKGEHVHFSYRDNYDNWKVIYQLASNVSTQRGRVILSEDWNPRHDLSTYERLDLFLDANAFRKMRDNLRTFADTSSWLRKLVCEPLTLEEYADVTRCSMHDPAFAVPSVEEDRARLALQHAEAKRVLAQNESQIRALLRAHANARTHTHTYTQRPRQHDCPTPPSIDITNVCMTFMQCT